MALRGFLSAWRHRRRSEWNALSLARRALFSVTALYVLVAALAMKPKTYGDFDYFLLTESLFNHLTPELTPKDLATLARACVRTRCELQGGFQDTYLPDRQQRWYCIHFWAYSLLCVPAKAILHLARADGFKAGALTNAAFFVALLWRILTLAAWTGRQRLGLALLIVFSPALWFIPWTHPEIFSLVFVALALSFEVEDKSFGAVFCAAIASLQNQPLVLMAGWLWLRHVAHIRIKVRTGRAHLWLHAERRRIGVLTLAITPVLLPPLFYWSHYGVMSVLARDTTSIEDVSLWRAWELVADLNIGMLPYVPGALMIGLAYLAAAFWRRRFLEASWGVVLFGMMLACTATQNWNHGTSGPSRYVIWMLPILFYVVAGTPAAARRLERPGPWRTLVGAIALQVAIVVARGGIVPQMDFLEHSYLARAVLDRWPALYQPSPEIFVERTVHQEELFQGPYVYVHEGRCRKAFAKRRHAARLVELCGDLPSSARDWFGQSALDRDQQKEWRYLNFD